MTAVLSTHEPMVTVVVAIRSRAYCLIPFPYNPNESQMTTHSMVSGTVTLDREGHRWKLTKEQSPNELGAEIGQWAMYEDGVYVAVLPYDLKYLCSIVRSFIQTKQAELAA
jgi:hypothetical protein